MGSASARRTLTANYKLRITKDDGRCRLSGGTGASERRVPARRGFGSDRLVRIRSTLRISQPAMGSQAVAAVLHSALNRRIPAITIPRVTPQQFVSKWSKADLSERSAVVWCGSSSTSVQSSKLPSIVMVRSVAACAAAGRSEERRVGKECTAWCRSRWSPYH